MVYFLYLEWYLTLMFTSVGTYSIYVGACIFTVCLYSFKVSMYLFFCSEKNPNKLPPYIFLIWQDNIVWILCMFKNTYVFENKRGVLQGREVMWWPPQAVPLEWPHQVKTGGCTYLLVSFIYIFLSCHFICSNTSYCWVFLVANFVLST